MNEHQFLPITRRARRVKLSLHRFNCMWCGVPIEEWSDEQTSLRMCVNCLRVRAYIDNIALPIPVQTRPACDWWDNWCMWYEENKQDLWRGAPNALQSIKEIK